MCLIGNTVVLCVHCRRIGPHLMANRKSHGFLELRQEPGVHSRVTAGWPFETQLCSAKLGLLSSYDGHLRNLNYAWQDHMDALGSEAGDQASVSIWHSDIGFRINFQQDSGIITF